MKKINYDKDVDALLIELSNEAIAYAENEGDVILHPVFRRLTQGTG
jgi:hypothetical protein